MNSFRTNPLPGYNDLVKACQTMLVLVHSEMKAMAKMGDAIDSALWTKFWNAVTRTDKYKIYAQKATDLLPSVEGYLSGVFEDYRTNCLTKLNVNEYLEWSNPLK